MEGLNFKSFYAQKPAVLLQARTMAFTTLAFSELLHMVGMSNVKESFVKIFKNKNWMMLVAFAVGILLQLLVIEVPGMRKVFSTENLSAKEWLVTALMSFIPLIGHEITVLVHKIKK